MAKAKDVLRKTISHPKTIGFALSFVFVSLIFAILNVYPFGTKTMLTVDLYHQYMPFIYELRARILEGRSLFYSWNTGLGTEYFAAYANYAASPLNILCVLFPYKTLPVFVAFVTALRAGLATVFMMTFLEGFDNRKSDAVVLLCGMSYAFCGWFLTDFWNIMWCDAWVLLPLICLGLIKLFKKKDFRLYVISLAVCLLSNFYSGYFICLFLAFFSVVLYLAVHEREEITLKSFAGCAVRFILGSLVAALIASIMILPTYLILQHSSATGDEFPKDYNLTGNLFDFLGRLMPSANPNIRDGMANVSCGTLAALSIPLFFMAPEKSTITRRQKFGFGFMVLLMYFSFSNRILNFIWHGFHFPNQIPYRQSFIMSFLLVTMAYMVLRNIKTYPKNRIAAVFAGAFIFLVLFEKIGEGKEGYQQIGLALLFLLVQGVSLRNYIRSVNGDKSFYSFVLAVTVIAEIFVSSLITMARVADNEGFTGYEYYAKNRDIIHNYAVEAEGTEGHSTFERTELYPNFICDIQSVYDVKGLSIFSSTARESFIKYIRNLGFHNNGINGLRNPGLTRVTAALLGVRNLATIESTRSVPLLYDLSYTEDDVKIYTNPDALSVGYMVSEDLLSFDPSDSVRDVFAKTNDFVSYLGSPVDVYAPVTVVNVSSDNANYNGPCRNGIMYSTIDTSNKITLTVDVIGKTMGMDVYLYVDSSKGGTVAISSDNVDSYSFEIRSYQIIYLGKYEGVPYHVTLTYNKAPSGGIEVYAYELKEEGYQQMLETLSDEQLQVTSYDDTSLTGTITTEEGGLLFLTIPYAEGFTLTVDGKETEITPIHDAFCGVLLDPGTHEIALKYKPEGLSAALYMTIAGLASLGMLILMPMMKPEKKVRPAPVPEEAPKDE